MPGRRAKRPLTDEEAIAVLRVYVERNPSVQLPCGCWATRCPTCCAEYSLVLDLGDGYCPHDRAWHMPWIKQELSRWEKLGRALRRAERRGPTR